MANSEEKLTIEFFEKAFGNFGLILLLESSIDEIKVIQNDLKIFFKKSNFDENNWHEYKNSQQKKFGELMERMKVY